MVKRNITSERARIGLSQKELATMLSVTEKTIRNWEQNPQKVSGSALAKMATIFNCSTDYLLGITDRRNLSA